VNKMVRVDFDSRILCDHDFVTWLLSRPDRAETLRRMMIIKGKSIHHKSKHNIILKFDFIKCQEENAVLKKNSHIIKAAMKVKDSPEFILDDEDNIVKRIRYAIWLTNQNPFKTYIFTSKMKKRNYEENKHMIGIKRVSIMAEEEAKDVIDSFFEQFKQERSG